MKTGVELIDRSKMRTIKFRGKRVNRNEWVKSMTISRGTIKRKMYDVFLRSVRMNGLVLYLKQSVSSSVSLTRMERKFTKVTLSRM
jgi:hypothetical protein